MAQNFQCNDLDIIMADWAQSITVKRSVASYDAAGAYASQVLTTVDTFDGDWQPASGRTIRDEEGLTVESVAFLIAPCNIDTEEDDQVILPDSSIYYVNYVREYEDHTTVYLKRTPGQIEA